jgi:hypothetical protein
MDNVISAGNDKVDGGGDRQGDMVGEPGDRISGSFALRGPHKHTIAVIVSKGWANVPAILGMGGPHDTLVGLDINEDSGAGWHKQRAMEVIVSVHLGPGQQLGVDGCAMNEVESEDALLKQAVPEVEQEVRVGAAEASNEVILEGVNGVFGRVGTVNTGRD